MSALEVGIAKTNSDDLRLKSALSHDVVGAVKNSKSQRGKLRLAVRVRARCTRVVGSLKLPLSVFLREHIGINYLL